MRELARTVLMIAILVACCLTLAGCDANVGVGVSVGIPVGNHGYVSVGSSSWL